MFFKKTKTVVPETNETKEVDSVQLWRVDWNSPWTENRFYDRRHCEFFPVESDAEHFAESLRAAFKLIKHPYHKRVECYKYK